MEKQNNKKMKIVLCGEAGVGKTSIIDRYVSKNFKENVTSSTGSTYAKKIVEVKELKRKVSLDIWDTAGQEKYRALTKSFFNLADAIIFVYDLTCRKSFDELENFWIGQAKENSCSQIVFGLAGNKSDLYEDEEVSEVEGRVLAKKIGAVYKLTSANIDVGINDLFEEITKEFLEKNNTIDFSKNYGKKFELSKKEKKMNKTVCC